MLFWHFLIDSRSSLYIQDINTLPDIMWDSSLTHVFFCYTVSNFYSQRYPTFSLCILCCVSGGFLQGICRSTFISFYFYRLTVSSLSGICFCGGVRLKSNFIHKPWVSSSPPPFSSSYWFKMPPCHVSNTHIRTWLQFCTPWATPLRHTPAVHSCASTHHLSYHWSRVHFDVRVLRLNPHTIKFTF